MWCVIWVQCGGISQNACMHDVNLFNRCALPPKEEGKQKERLHLIFITEHGKELKRNEKRVKDTKGQHFKTSNNNSIHVWNVVSAGAASAVLHHMHAFNGEMNVWRIVRLWFSFIFWNSFNFYGISNERMCTHTHTHIQRTIENYYRYDARHKDCEIKIVSILGCLITLLNLKTGFSHMHVCEWVLSHLHRHVLCSHEPVRSINAQAQVCTSANLAFNSFLEMLVPWLKREKQKQN